MANWGPGTFENDVAAALVVAIIKTGDLDIVTRALVIDADDIIDADVGQAAMVAAEIIAALRGKASKSFPKELTRWVVRQPKPDAKLLKRARRAVKLCAGKTNAENSELRQLWEGRLEEWSVPIRDLLGRLKG